MENRRTFLTWAGLSCLTNLIVEMFNVQASQAKWIKFNLLNDQLLLSNHTKSQPQSSWSSNMRIEINCPDSIRADEECHIRVLLFNDSYEPVMISRNAFVGPNLKVLSVDKHPLPESVEGTFGGLDEPLTLQSFTFYGRERTFSELPPGKIEVSAYYRLPEQEGISASYWLIVE